MGVRGRNSQNKVKQVNKQKLNQAIKLFTRTKAENALREGADPSEERFQNHANYHPRRRAWQMMGRPLPEEMSAQNKFLATLQGTETPNDSGALAGFYQLIRQRILKEVPVKEADTTITETV
jgi:hypothetical protein